MEELEQQIIQQVKHALKNAIVAKLGGYNSPLDKLIANAIARHENRLSILIEDAFASSVKDDAFKEEIRVAVREKLARVLVSKMGGEIEKQVNDLKSSPSTRARITLAIEQIVSGQ